MFSLESIQMTTRTKGAFVQCGDLTADGYDFLRPTMTIIVIVA